MFCIWEKAEKYECASSIINPCHSSSAQESVLSHLLKLFRQLSVPSKPSLDEADKRALVMLLLIASHL